MLAPWPRQALGPRTRMGSPTRCNLVTPYPSQVQRIALMDAFLPGVGDWKNA